MKRSKGLQVAIISLIRKYNPDSYESISGASKKLKNKLVVIAPFSFCSPKALIKAFKNNVIVHEKMKILMIDEIEANSQDSFHDYKHAFKRIGIEHVYEEKLGFGENCIGYLPIRKSECTTIKQRLKIELEKLFDSFNLNVDSSAHYYVSYLSSDIKITASQVFIVNTLCELQDNPSSVNYIFSLGNGNWESDVERMSRGTCDILPFLEEINKDIADKFSKVNIILIHIYKNYVHF